MAPFLCENCQTKMNIINILTRIVSKQWVHSSGKNL